MPTRAPAHERAPARHRFGTAPEILPLPNLVQHQRDSFHRFVTEGLAELFAELSPIADFTAKQLELELSVPADGPFGPPKHTEDECRDRDLTYTAPLYADARLRRLRSGEILESRLFLGDFPLMTPRGTFVVNGSERVVVSQLVRSAGVYFTADADPLTGRKLFGAKLIPGRGAWLELDTSRKGAVSVKVDRKRKFPVEILLAALAALDSPAGDPAARAALVELHQRLRPGDPATPDAGRDLLHNLFFNPRRYDLSKVGRYKLNKRLHSVPHSAPTTRALTPGDLVAIVAELNRLNDTQGEPDDIDHLGNRRVRAVGELIHNQFRIGLSRMERTVRERMTIQDTDTATPASLVNIRPLVAAMKEFFGGSQLSQFMDQTNPLAELAQLRKLSAMGPGGLSRDRAGFDVRDVHESHYGRICPVETQEGTSIGLVGALATYGRIDDYGFIQTPYRRVVHQDGAAHVTDEIVYVAADDEERHVIAQASSAVDERGRLTEHRVSGRHAGAFGQFPRERVELMDVSPHQTISASAAMIPFLEHDDAARALMGANYQRQAVPLLRPQAPLVATGLETQAARDSGRLVLATTAGTVVSATAGAVVVRDSAGRDHHHALHQFVRSNDGTCLHHRPIVATGDDVATGQVIADTMSTEGGELALGQNVLCAFMFWEGANFEDAILISERLVQDDTFTSIHLEHYEVEARDTKLGPEEITRDLPNLSEETLRQLDDDGCVYVGARVQPGDVLVGKITPKGETELTAEERLLRAIFGEKAREVKDTSLRVPSGEYGTVVDVRRFSRAEGDDLPPGIQSRVRVAVAVKRKLTEGDKLSGRHGNKGVIARILPVEDMPYLEDGTPVDIILSPLGAPSRMNVGTVLEAHLGWAAAALGMRVATPVFDSACEDEIESLLVQAGLPASGKATLYDGRTGDPFEQEVCVGHVYMLKLHHLVEDKVHARSTGPYSLITQQPLGGKAQFGGQRLGLMEVWALEAYGAAHTLQEMLTVKSDDDTGRVKTYEAIVKGGAFPQPGVPAAFKLAVKELQALGLNVELFDEDERPLLLQDPEPDDEPIPALGVNLSGFED
ncbi:MAG TPA: DNA-directed RNA polymerase subunit beta [Chloroflexota bacterium]|nr:DNA-directed RNA polymerase subunit beta [Chloroflexota bacterium]